MSEKYGRVQTMRDWQGRSYEVEIAFVAFLGGYVIWVDDGPFNEGEPFPSSVAAIKELESHMAGVPDSTAVLLKMVP